MNELPSPEDLIGPDAIHQGHFVLESGYHRDLWLDLELLALHPTRLRPHVVALAEHLRDVRFDLLCGPLNEGAFLGLLLADHLGVDFCYAERFESGSATGLFPVEYRLPKPLRSVVEGKRVVIVNDVVSAGSAIRGAFGDLVTCGAKPIALACLLILGDSGERFAAQAGMDVITLGRSDFPLWLPDTCPLCQSGQPTEHR